jgi:hypothetical protein
MDAASHATTHQTGVVKPYGPGRTSVVFTDQQIPPTDLGCHD